MAYSTLKGGCAMHVTNRQIVVGLAKFIGIMAGLLFAIHALAWLASTMGI